MHTDTVLARRAARLSRPGFSLLEMMLVVIIIGILATVVVYNFAGAGDVARRNATITKMSQIKAAIAQYNARFGDYPPSLDPLATGNPPILEKVPLDGWDQIFLYRVPSQDPSRPFDLISLGKDKRVNTPDDIDVWTMDQTQ